MSITPCFAIRVIWGLLYSAVTFCSTTPCLLHPKLFLLCRIIIFLSSIPSVFYRGGLALSTLVDNSTMLISQSWLAGANEVARLIRAALGRVRSAPSPNRSSKFQIARLRETQLNFTIRIATHCRSLNCSPGRSFVYQTVFNSFCLVMARHKLNAQIFARNLETDKKKQKKKLVQVGNSTGQKNWKVESNYD